MTILGLGEMAPWAKGSAAKTDRPELEELMWWKEETD